MNYQTNLVISLLLWSGVTVASECPEHYWKGAEPTLQVPLQRDQELCYEAFATGYSYQTKTAFYSAEHLTMNNLKRAKRLDRRDSFHEEIQLPESARAELRDYKGSGFDRGHLAPNADMPTRKAQAESFSLANMVPQLHKNNAGIWSEIESTARQLAEQNDEVYVVTGGVYERSTQKINRRIPVPNALFKAIYIPAKNQAGVYLSDNNASGDYAVISVNELKKLTGIDVFPKLPDAVKAKVASLPEPQVQNNQKRTKQSHSFFETLLRRMM